MRTIHSAHTFFPVELILTVAQWSDNYEGLHYEDIFILFSCPSSKSPDFCSAFVVYISVAAFCVFIKINADG